MLVSARRMATPDTSAPTLFSALAALPRDLWLVLVAKFLESVSLFSVLYTATLWLSKEFGASDLLAGSIFGAFATAVALLTMVVGVVVDWLGVRAALAIAFATSAVARATMTFAPSFGVALAGMFLLAIGTSAGVPVMSAAVRQYTTPAARPVAFGAYYVLLNLGVATAAALFDASRARSPESPFRPLYVVGVVAAVLSFLIALALRPPPSAAREPDAPRAPPLRIAREVVREAAFWRFMLLVSLIATVTLVHQHFHATWPKYVLREMGEAFPVGRVAAINSTSILVLAPLAALAFRKRDALEPITIGAVIGGASPFVLCLGPSAVAIVAMVCVMSVGEALWAPRFYEYAASIAPRGREATYASLSSLPMFLAKMVAGPTSGYLLTRYCPEVGPRNSATMWLVIGAMTVTGPLALVALRGYIGRARGPARERAKLDVARERR